MEAHYGICDPTRNLRSHPSDFYSFALKKSAFCVQFAPQKQKSARKQLEQSLTMSSRFNEKYSVAPNSLSKAWCLECHGHESAFRCEREWFHSAHFGFLSSLAWSGAPVSLRTASSFGKPCLICGFSCVLTHCCPVHVKSTTREVSCDEIVICLHAWECLLRRLCSVSL